MASLQLLVFSESIRYSRPTNPTTWKKSMERGFSLSEVLISLLLVASLSFALLKHQWQLHRIANHTKLQAQQWLAAHNDHERGMSLIELVIALGLAASIITLLLQLYNTTFQTFLNTQAILQQTAQWQLTLSFMHAMIAHAGFTPCLPLSGLQTFDPKQQHTLTAWTLDNQDPSRITVYRMGDHFLSVKRVSPQQLSLLTSDAVSLKAPLLIADCQHAEVINAATQHASTMFLQHPLVFQYTDPIYVGEWQSVTFGLHAASHTTGQHLYYAHPHRELLLPHVQSLSWRRLSASQLQADLQLEGGTVLPIRIRLRNAL